MRLYVNGVGALGPGLGSWPECRDALAGRCAYSETEPPEPSASVLPPNERRRSSNMVRWAVHVAHQSLRHAQADAHEVATVFASSDGETGVLDRLCTALATSDRVISPTLFHHSVHNAAAGYWGIATGSQQSSTSSSCYDSSFPAGLLEAAAYADTQRTLVLLVAYDLLMPPPLFPARPLAAGFAVAFVLGPTPSRQSFAQLDLDLSNDPSGEATQMVDARLEALRRGNPAARSLPLLAALARGQCTSISFEYLDQHLLIYVTPWPS
jgi:beta-ketoacyl synthase-like protein